MKSELPTPELKNLVLNRIASEKLCPHSKWYFLSREGLLWVLWFLTVKIGAVAVAVTLSVVVYRQYAFFEATHDSFIRFMVEVLPFVWFAIFALMAIFAVYNLRHTKRGYRYPLWQIFGSSMLLSLSLGTILHFIGFGFVLDEQLGKKVSMYDSQIKMEEKMWQMPEEGRLIGMTHMTPAEYATGEVRFIDVNGTEWTLDVTELDAEDVSFLNLGKRVRVMGQKNINTTLTFHACGVLPWVYEKQYSIKELNAFKVSMQKRMNRFGEYSNNSGLDGPHNSVCAGIKLIRTKHLVAPI